MGRSATAHRSVRPQDDPCDRRCTPPSATSAVDNAAEKQGIVVVDELKRAKGHLLIDQMQWYFRETAVGRHRASRIIPEPFFVHSELTAGVQIADLVAYVASWGLRIPRMIKPAREELSPFANQIAQLRYRTVRDRH